LSEKPAQAFLDGADKRIAAKGAARAGVSAKAR